MSGRGRPRGRPHRGPRPAPDRAASTPAASEPIELTIERPVAGGRMLARADGRVVLVAGAIPGETVRARIERVERGVAFARVEAVLTPSPDRREPFFDAGVRRRRLRARRSGAAGRAQARGDPRRPAPRRRARLGAAARRGRVARTRLPAAGASPRPRRPHRVLQGRHARPVRRGAVGAARRRHARRRAPSRRRARRGLRRVVDREPRGVGEPGRQRARRAPASDRPRAGRDDACRRRSPRGCSSTASPACRWPRAAAAR